MAESQVTAIPMMGRTDGQMYVLRLRSSVFGYLMMVFSTTYLIFLAIHCKVTCHYLKVIESKLQCCNFFGKKWRKSVICMQLFRGHFKTVPYLSYVCALPFEEAQVLVIYFCQESNHYTIVMWQRRSPCNCPWEMCSAPRIMQEDRPK